MKKSIISEYFQPAKKKTAMAKGGPLGMGICGFIAPEVAQMVYALFTVMVILFTWTNIENPSALMWQRVSFLSGTLALWLVYQMWPCKFIMLCRVCYLLAILGSWYPDTYVLNHQFGSYDHVFAQLEQSVFECQPAALFSQKFSSAVVSELMYFGYFSYYLFFVVVTMLVFFRSYQQLERVTFMIFTGFFLCYVVYVFMPVAGPQYYYPAVGMGEILRGHFPDVGHYFTDNTTAITAPGWSGGLFYKIMYVLHHAGERPTAAFPSSHVAIATLVMCIAAKLKMWKYFIVLAVPYLFLCMSTVYIYAHYAIDSIAGFLVGIAFFFVLGGFKLRS